MRNLFKFTRVTSCMAYFSVLLHEKSKTDYRGIVIYEFGVLCVCYSRVGVYEYNKQNIEFSHFKAL